MHILLILALVFVFFAGVQRGWFGSSFARIVIRFDRGELEVSKGQLSAQGRRYIADVLREHCVKQGTVSVSGQSTVQFSSSIPEAARQQIRNILLNL